MKMIKYVKISSYLVLFLGQKIDWLKMSAFFLVLLLEKNICSVMYNLMYIPYI